MAGKGRERARPAAALRAKTDGDASGEGARVRGGEGRSLAEIAAGRRRREAPFQKISRAVMEGVALAERDGSRRGDLFEAIRKSVGMSKHVRPHDAELVVRMVTVLLDAGRPVHLNEASRRVKERWGSYFTESALYAAKSSGAIATDPYGVLYLQRPVGDGRGEGERWMYKALEKAVGLGAARYTDDGIEMAGGAGGLTPREMAGAEAVAMGVTEYGEPPGLAEWLDRSHRSRGGGRRTTWAEATVEMCGGRAEVGAAYARIMAAREGPPRQVSRVPRARADPNIGGAPQRARDGPRRDAL